MLSELPPLPDEAAYAEATKDLNDVFEREGIAAAISHYVTARRSSLDFSNARTYLYDKHLVYFDEDAQPDEDGRAPRSERKSAHAAMKGFVLQEMIADRIHPPVWSGWRRIARLYNGLDFAPLEETIEGVGGLQSPHGELYLAQLIATRTFEKVGSDALERMREWALLLVPNEKEREAFTALLGASLFNSRLYHRQQLQGQHSDSEDSLFTSK